MRFLAAALLSLAPTLALGQTTTAGIALSFQGANASGDRVINADACGADLQVNWTAQSILPCGGLTIWLTTATCGDQPATGDKQVGDAVPQQTLVSQQTGSVSMKISDLPAFAADGGTACGAAIEATYKLCGSVKVTDAFGSCNQYNHANATGSVVYDAVPPGPPTVTDVTPLDGALEAAFTATDDTVVVHIFVGLADGGDLTERGTTGRDQSPTRINGLENDTAYSVALKSEDVAGNVSGLSAPVMGTPKHTVGFVEQYQHDGGTEQGGCSVGPWGLGMAWAIPLVWLFARRRRS